MSPRSLTSVFTIDLEPHRVVFAVLQDIVYRGFDEPEDFDHARASFLIELAYRLFPACAHHLRVTYGAEEDAFVAAFRKLVREQEADLVKACGGGDGCTFLEITTEFLEFGDSLDVDTWSRYGGGNKFLNLMFNFHMNVKGIMTDPETEAEDAETEAEDAETETD